VPNASEIIIMQFALARSTKAHHYRAENPLAHLHEDEAPVETDKLKSFH
jgi:hypothetical protein